MNRLVRPAPSGEPVPDLAVSWSANDSADVWTFKLRAGVKFHDGTDFDAADVVDLLNRIKDPDLDSPVASVLAVMENIEAVDPLTVKNNPVRIARGFSAPYDGLPDPDDPVGVG